MCKDSQVAHGTSPLGEGDKSAKSHRTAKATYRKPRERAIFKARPPASGKVTSLEVTSARVEVFSAVS